MIDYATHGRRAGKRYAFVRKQLEGAGATEADFEEVDRLARETTLDWFEAAERVYRAVHNRERDARQLWPDLVRSSARRMVFVDGTVAEMPCRNALLESLQPPYTLPSPFPDWPFASPYLESTPLPPRGLAALGCGLASDPMAGIGPAGGR